MNSLYEDAIITDRYDADVLNKLSEEDKKLRLHEAYYYTTGEIYARRAAKNANRDAKELRNMPDQTSKHTAEIAGYFALSPAPAGGIALSDQRTIDAIKQFSKELDAQPEQTQFNPSAFARFARGSNTNPETVQKQVEAHKDHLMDGLEGLGLKDEFESALAAQGEEKSYVDALDAVKKDNFDQSEFMSQEAYVLLKTLENDAIIIDRYSKEALSKLDEEEKANRLFEIYSATIAA